MKKNIPNDLSSFPSVNDYDAEVQNNKETAVEGSSQKIDEKIYKKITDKNTFSFFSSAILISVVLIAVLVLGRSASQMIIDSFKFALWYGYTISTVIAIITFLISRFLFKEIYSIIKLKTYNNLKQAFSIYQKNKGKAKNLDNICREAGKLINFIKLNDKTIKQHQIKQTFEDIDFAENIEGVKKAVEDNLLFTSDKKVKNIIADEAVNVAIGTIISPYGFLDALIVLYRNVRMIKKIIFTYRIKPGFLGTASIIKHVAFVVATSGLMQEASALALAGVQSLPINILGRSAMQGLSSAFLTIRVGLITQNSCRPINLDKNRYGELMSVLLSNVKDKIKKLITSKNNEL